MTQLTFPLGNVQPKQREFMKAVARYVGFGGARGGGKSHAVRKKAPLLALEYKGIRILILRRTFPQVLANHIIFMRVDLYQIAKYNDKDKQFTFPNGSVIVFGYCDNDRDVERYQGIQFDIIFLDEATNLRQEWIEKIMASNRGVNSFPKRMYFTMNPGGESHQYLKRLFIDQVYQDDENPDDYQFIQSLVTDNQALMEADPDYIKKLESLPYKLKQAWRYGSWDIYEGMFFEEFVDDPAHYQDRLFTHVIEPFEIPTGWQIYRSMDEGYAKPFSVGWWAIDYDGIAYRILEMYGIGREPNEGIRWNPDQVFSEIGKLERSHPWLKGKDIIGIADPSMWNKSKGFSTVEMGIPHNVFFTPADNDRITGWMQCHYRMRFDENGIPMVYFFKNCKHLIRTIPLMMYDKVKVEDLDSDLEDHACDEFRYFCMSRPIVPSLPVVEKPLVFDPLAREQPMNRYRRNY